MKIEVEIPDSVAHAIAERVAASLRPMLVPKKGECGDGILTPDQLVGYLHVTKQWVYERVALGEIPHTKVGKYLRFRRSVVDRWLESQSVPATNPLSRTLKTVTGGSS